MNSKVWDYCLLTLVIIGAINWGLIGFFQFDLSLRILFPVDAGLQPVQKLAGAEYGAPHFFSDLLRLGRAEICAAADVYGAVLLVLRPAGGEGRGAGAARLGDRCRRHRHRTDRIL